MRRLCLLAVLAALFLLAGCGQVQVISLEASWAGNYPDLHSLKQAADLAIRGRIAGVASVTTEQGTPYTDFNVSVSKVLVSRSGARPSTILLHQTGALEGNTLYQIDDDPLFQVGEQVILFLHEYAPGRYFVLGGPRGRLEVDKDGLVRPINNEGLKLAPTPEGQFENMVESA
jgi:hypothetical protein